VEHTGAEKLYVSVRLLLAEVLKDHNISSVGIGYKVKDNKPTRSVDSSYSSCQVRISDLK
jgi:hypothetical protein